MTKPSKPSTPQARTITIVCRDGNSFDVHQGELYSGRLCWEEMLGQIATLTHPQINAPRFRMETPEEHEARRARWSKPDPNVVDAAIVDPVSHPETP